MAENLGIALSDSDQMPLGFVLLLLLLLFCIQEKERNDFSLSFISSMVQFGLDSAHMYLHVDTSSTAL